MDKPIHLVKDWLWRIDRTVQLPPLCLEVVLRDGVRYYVRTVMQKDEPTRTIVLRIWDMRAIADVQELVPAINEWIKHQGAMNELHPNLDEANLRIQMDEILYCIEWHLRFWPEAAREVWSLTTTALNQTKAK